MSCVQIPQGVKALETTGVHSPAFSFVSKAGSVSVRLEAGARTQQARLNMMVGQAEWSIGVIEGSSFSICYGTTCAIRFDVDGRVHFLGAANFHHQVEAVAKTITDQNADRATGRQPNRETMLQAEMGFELGQAQRTDGLIDVDLEDQSLNAV